MANSNVTVWEMPKLPAEVADFFDKESNIQPREMVPTLNPGGKRWKIVIGGDEKVLMRKDADGDEVPLQIFRGFVLGYGEHRGRTYYSSGYDETRPGRPTCWSEDNIKPDVRVPDGDRQNAVCNGCPMSIKGSQVSQDGRDVKACKEHLLLSLVPNRNLGEYPPLRLKLSITSIYDGKQPEREQTNWFSWSRYLDHLLKIMPQNVHTARVLTKVKFDSTVQYPKLLFQAERQAETEEFVALVKILREEKETIKAMTSGLIPSGALGVKAGEDAKSDSEDEDDQPAPVKKSSPAPTKKAAPPDEEDEVIPPKKAAAKAEAAKDVTPKKPKVDPDEDAEVPQGMRAKKSDPDDEEAPKKVNGAAAVEAKAPDDPKPATPGKGNIKDLLKDWDD